MTRPRDEQLTYEQVADLVERELGERPAISTLRAAASVAARSTRQHGRLTAGMPAPVGAAHGLNSGGRPPAVFSRRQIESWLRSHPRRQRRAWQQKIIGADNERTRARLVQQARREGLAWQAIADAIAEASGTPYTKQAAQQRYGRG